MDLYLQSLRLSVHTFWRYLIVVIVGAVAALFLARRASSAEVVWLLLTVPAILIAVLFTVFWLLVASLAGILVVGGVYSALVARGHAVTRSFGTILRLVVLVGISTVVGYFLAGYIGSMILYLADLAGGPGDAATLMQGLRAGSPAAHLLFLVLLLPFAAGLVAVVFPVIAILRANGDRPQWHHVTYGLADASRHLLPMAAALLYGTAMTPAILAGPVFFIDAAGLAALAINVWAAGWFFSHAVLVWEGKAADLERVLTLAEDRRTSNRPNARDLRLLRERKNPDIL